MSIYPFIQGKSSNRTMWNFLLNRRGVFIEAFNLRIWVLFNHIDLNVRILNVFKILFWLCFNFFFFFLSLHNWNVLTIFFRRILFVLGVATRFLNYQLRISLRLRIKFFSWSKWKVKIFLITLFYLFRLC